MFASRYSRSGSASRSRISSNGSARRSRVLSNGILGCALLSSIVFSSAATPIAQAEDIDALIADMETISREATDKNEQVKQLETEIEDSTRALAEIDEQIRVTTIEADAARDRETTSRQEINRLAGAKYRGTIIDPITNAISAENPQNAIDRAAYMTSLTRHSRSTLEGLAAITAEASEKRGLATRAKAQAQYQQSTLKKQLEELSKDQEELHRRIEDIEARVQALSPEQRQAWEAKNGPIEYSLAGVTGSESGMAAVQAAMSKLGSPYGWGATGPSQFDCSGLMVWAFQQQGKTLPRTSQAQMAGGQAVSRNDLQPGDVIGFFPGATHVGMYVGNGMIVHASDYGIPVQVVPVDSMPFYGARRY